MGRLRFTSVAALGCAAFLVFPSSVRAVQRALISVVVAAPTVSAADAGKGEKSAKTEKAAADSANPLANDDPFVGEFSSEEMLVILRLTVDGYAGEIRRGGKNFPLKAAVDAGKLAGTFAHDQAEYRFTAVLDGAMLKLTTGNKVYTLKRKTAGETPAPVPAPPVPAPVAPVPAPVPRPAPPVPTPPVPAPVSPVPAPLPQPAPTPVTPTPELTSELLKPNLTGPLPQHLGYAELAAQKLSDLPWARFPAGAFVVFDECVGATSVVPQTARRKLVLETSSNERPRLRNHDWIGSGFDKTGVPVAPSAVDNLFRIGELGYTKGTTVADNLTVQGVTLRCERTTYTGETKLKTGAMQVSAEVWRCREVDIPPLVVELPSVRILLEPDIVRLRLTCDIRGIAAVIDQKLDTIAAQTKVGDQTVRYAVAKNTSTFDRGNGKDENTAEYWLSSQIPGGILKTVQVTQAGDKSRTATVTAVDFANFPRN